jgi:hypothetical protein
MKSPAGRRKTVAVLVLLGLLFALGAAVEAHKALRARNFRSVRGVVAASRVERQWRSYRPIVEYRYVVGGQQYDAATYDPSDTDGTDVWATKIVGRYPRGVACTVYFNPQQPDDAVLCQWPTARALTVIVICGFAGMAMLASGVFLARRYGRETSRSPD